MKLLGCEERKAFIEGKTHLMPENRQGTCASTVMLFRTAAKNEFYQVEILTHRLSVVYATQKVGKFTPDHNCQHTLLSTPEQRIYGRPTGAMGRPRNSVLSSARGR